MTVSVGTIQGHFPAFQPHPDVMLIVGLIVAASRSR